MPLNPGTRLGPYEILSPLGAGGMGEVYRARDTRLDRDVAIKVLPQHLSSNSEVRARFEREAKTVSSLNHPNICVLHDVGREADTDYLVMELIDGETLAQRITRGPLPPAEVLKIGAQIADALDRAHRAGVIHRDLKPGNVMLTKSGAKLMDFGLARGTGLAGAPGSGVSIAGLTQSPTIAQPLTAEGTIIGTFQYMAPEQLEGRETDTHSDIWALGCVLYEMATGTRAFEGKSQASLIATIMHTEPKPLDEIAPASPPALDRLIRECLAKDPEERRQSAGDVRRELNRIARGEADALGTGVQPAGSSRARWFVVAAAVGLIGALGGFFIGHRGEKSAPAEKIAFPIPPPPGTRFRFTIDEDGTRLAPPRISPDGTVIVFGLVDAKGQRVLVRRSIHDIAVTPINGSEEGRMPFFSPDGKMLAFFSDGKLRKVAADGGAPIPLTDGARNPRGASWSHKGVILYAPSANSPIYAIPDAGGAPQQVTFPDTTLPDISHRYPFFLPDDEHFLFLVWTNNGTVRDSVGGIYMGSLHSRETTRVSSAASSVVYRNGNIMFARDGILMKAPFDVKSGKMGNASATDRHVDWDPSLGLALFDISDNGTLVYRETGADVQTRLVWFNRAGEPIDSVGTPAAYTEIGISRGGTGAAASIANPGGDSDIWLLDFARGLTSRFTRSSSNEEDPKMSTDGRSVAYTSDVAGPYHAFIGPADRSSAPERVSPQSDDWNLLDWSMDGRLLLLATSTSLWVVDAKTHQGEEWHRVPGSFASSWGSFSPDARWIAYTSPESGRDEIYVRPYPGPGGQWQVSLDGGFRPHWSNDGRELVYTNLDGDLISVQVDTRDGFRTEKPHRLFRIGPKVVWAPAGDHSRFLVAVRSREDVDPPLNVITHWLAPAP
ncbi:MAG TPA: protein kinase [Candidatus Krumholzibacteria bacterium]|nr:protein kinase [Candidatus Krumholzibacteria bacterium]